MSEFEFQLATRGALYLIIHGIAWVCVMFLADFFFGDDAAFWVIVPFSIASTSLTIMFAKARKKFEEQAQSSLTTK